MMLLPIIFYQLNKVLKKIVKFIILLIYLFILNKTLFHFITKNLKQKHQVS